MLSRTLKSGTKCVVVGNNSRHNREIGSVVTIHSFYNNGGGAQDGYTTREFGGTYFTLFDLVLWEQSKEDIQEEVDGLNVKLETLKEKLSYLAGTGKEAVNLKEFKEYRMSKIIADDTLSPEEKAKMIMNVVEDKPNEKKVKVVKKKAKVDVPESEEVEEMEDEMPDTEMDMAGHGY